MDRASMADHSVKIGELAPDFELVNTDGKPWRLSEQRGNVVALLLYPKNETLMCTRQLCSVRDHWREYVESKATIVGVSEGSVIEHSRFAKKYFLPLPLLADTNREVTNLYNFHWIFPNILTRAVVIIDGQGIIRSRTVMLRAFRPPDREILTSIYAARADSLTAQYEGLTGKV